MHLADACAIFKSDFNIICTVGFPQPVISAREHTVSRLSLLTTGSTSVPLPEFLSGGLPIRSATSFPREIPKVICILKPVIQ